MQVPVPEHYDYEEMLRNVDITEGQDIERYIEEITMDRLDYLTHSKFMQEMRDWDLPEMQPWEQLLPFPLFNIEV